jgi:hypothetical protein
MRLATLVAICGLFGVSCGDAATKDDVDSGTNPDDTDDTDDTDVDTGEDDSPYPSSFPGGKYRVTKLQLATESDTDGDGTVDNNLANVFGMIDLLITTEDLSALAFNERMQSNLNEWLTNVLIEATNDQGNVDYMLYSGIADEAFNLTIDPSSLDENGEAVVHLTGAFTTEQGFYAGPGTVSIPVAFIAEEPTVPVSMEQALFDGVLTIEQTAGVLTGALPIDDLLETVIEPMIVDEGADINGDGIPETKEAIMDLVESIAPAAADVDLGSSGIECSGDTDCPKLQTCEVVAGQDYCHRWGVSARFSFVGIPANF